MDPSPQIPTINTVNDYNTICLIRNSFGDKGEPFPEDIANNLRTYTAEDPLDLRQIANNVFAIYQYLEEGRAILNNIELDIIKQHGDFLYAKSTWMEDKNMFMREMIKLQSCDIFSKIYPPDKLRYGFIEKCDLYPDDLRQFLNFRFNSSFHQCEKCFSRNQFKNETPQIKQPNCFVPKNQPKNAFGLIFEPSKIIFKNFELNQQYKQIVKIKNTSATMQKVSVKSYPKFAIFKILFGESQKIAPGMYTSFTIKFTPQCSLNLKDKILFVSRKGEIIKLPIECYREPPKLLVYINNSTSIIDNIPGSKHFSKERQLAINDTIDCGTCFATDYTLISVILKNEGNKAKFFWLSEDDFYFQDINTVTSNYEYYKDCFWMYPTYFEMSSREICEINIIFQPLHCGVYAETLYLMCDNNFYTQVELVGDAVCFNKNLISVKIPSYVDELEKKESHCIFMGHLMYKEKSQFTLSILNKSAIPLKFELRLDSEDEIFSMCEWFKVSKEPPSYLTPYSETDILFEGCSPSNISEGYYNAKLRLFIKNIPIGSLEANEVFLVNTKKEELGSIVKNLQKVDVLIAEVEIACYINNYSISQSNNGESLIECEKCGNVNCLCESCKENLILADLEFDLPFMELGILPIGADIRKKFFIINRGEKDANWTIIELKYNLDYPPHVEVLKEKNLSCFNGTLKPLKKQRLSYTIIKKSPARYVSILVLYLVKDNVPNIDNQSKWNFIAQDICVITYEVIRMDIAFKTQSKQAILCPLQMLYTGVPIEVSFKLKNYSLIPGCFYFLTPIGQDAEKISIEYLPESGELKANGSKKIILRLTCKEVGILEDIFIPCFIGKNQEPIRLRLLCVIDCVHVFFYLPTQNNDFQKVLWPPKLVYEQDTTWSDHCFCEESSIPLKVIQSENEINLEAKSNDTLKKISNSSINTETDDILKTLESVDSDIFLQDYVMEVRGVKTKEPSKFTIFFENVTTKPAKYSIQSTNYLAKEWKNCPGPKHIKAEDFWEPMIEHSGIVIQPEKESSYMKANELVTVDIWIYAKTWGIYVDEIIIDIENIIPFSFSLIIEITGCPLELPIIGIGAITQYPTIRFGSVTFASEDILREIIIKNVSSVDVTISWHVYYYSAEEINCNSPFNFVIDMTPKEELFELSFTDRFFGIEGIQFIEVQSSKSEITSDNQIKLPIVFKPKLVKHIGNLIRCFILGQIFTNETDTIKSSYFYRKPTTTIIEVTATVEEPHLLVEMEDNLLSAFANDVIFGTQSDFFIKFVLRNPTSSQITAKIDASDPFFCESNIEIGPKQCKEIHLTCCLTYEKILKWASIVYDSEKKIRQSQTQSEVINLGLIKNDGIILKPSISDDKSSVDKVNKIITFHKKGYIYYPHGKTEIIPIKLMLNYPNISVKPLHIKFEYILVGRTQKTTIIISNLTACPIKFEIFKSCSTHELVVTPSFGEIEKSTGMNSSFQHVTVYFTPKQCKMYHESIRIATNIPQYFVDVSVKGAASFNEKFDI